MRVVLAEDNVLLRQGVEKLIAQQAGLELGTANDLPGLLALVEEVEPDVVVTDIRMPPTGTDEGIQAAAHLRQHRPDIGVVVLSQYANPEYALALAVGRLGPPGLPVEGVVAGVDELVRAIRTWPTAVRWSTPPWSTPWSGHRHPAGPRTSIRLTSRETGDPGRDGPGKNNAAIAASLSCPSGRWRSTPTPSSPNSGSPRRRT